MSSRLDLSTSSRVLIGLVASLLWANQAIAQPDALCSADLMKAYKIHIPHAEFYRSDVPAKPSQILCESVYRIPGKYARYAESVLVRRFGMGKLRFACCGWFPGRGKRGAADGTFRHSHLMSNGAYAAYGISMSSEETLEKQWDRIEYFYITLTIYEI